MKELKRFKIFSHDYVDILLCSKRALLFFNALDFKVGDIYQFLEFDGKRCSGLCLKVKITSVLHDYKCFGMCWSLVCFEVIV